MRRVQREGLLQVLHRLGRALMRQREHQVEIEVGEARAMGGLGGATGLIGRMDPAQRLEQTGLKALYADGQPVHARGPVFGKAGLLDGAGVGLQGDLRLRPQRQQGAHAG